MKVFCNDGISLYLSAHPLFISRTLLSVWKLLSTHRIHQIERFQSLRLFSDRFATFPRLFLFLWPRACICLRVFCRLQVRLNCRLCRGRLPLLPDSVLPFVLQDKVPLYGSRLRNSSFHRLCGKDGGNLHRYLCCLWVRMFSPVHNRMMMN